MVSYQLYVVPMDLGHHINVDAVALTASIQVGWIEQLTKMPHRFVLHIDGKHKIHFGKWIMITVGTHSIVHHNGALQVQSEAIVPDTSPWRRKDKDKEGPRPACESFGMHQ